MVQLWHSCVWTIRALLIFYLPDLKNIRSEFKKDPRADRKQMGLQKDSRRTNDDLSLWHLFAILLLSHLPAILLLSVLGFRLRFKTQQIKLRYSLSKKKPLKLGPDLMELTKSSLFTFSATVANTSYLVAQLLVLCIQWHSCQYLVSSIIVIQYH